MLVRLVVLVVVFVIIPAIGFIIRGKWRYAAARREEVKRLLIFASEEAARAEIEATEGYSYTANTSSSFPTPDSAWIPTPDPTWVPPAASVPVAPSLRPVYQCAVCFSPTTTGCAKCKAVRYCSGRCQIVHWRQRHKDECLPYVAMKPVRDVSVSSLKQEDSKDLNDTLTDNNQPEIRSVSQSTSESSSEYSTFSTTSSRSSTEGSSSSVDGDHSSVKDSKPFTRSNLLVNKSVTSPVSSSKSGLASQFTKHVTTVNEVQNKVAKLTQHSGSRRNGWKTSMLKFVDQIKPLHKYSCKSLFSYEMFVKLYNWKQVELQPFGLINCGNSCYANAVLHCLIYTPPIHAYLLQGLHSKACDKRDWCFTCEFEGLVLKAKNGSSSLSPIRILSQIENIRSNLGRGREEDAHEFLRCAVNALQSVCLKEAGTNTTNSLEEETTLVGLTFGGYLKSKIKCMKCGGKSEQHVQMMDLTVENRRQYRDFRRSFE